MFQKIDKYGFKLGSEKCEFFMKQIRYLRQIIDENGRRPDLERAETIKNMLSPNNVTNLQVFSGLANYYSICIPKIYDFRAPLNDLLKKDRKWIWSKECKAAFQKIKSYMLVDLSLAHFDSKKEIIVASDVNNYGIGVVILHKFKNWTTKPIVHMSRILLTAERNYRQIEKESLAIFYVINKHHRLIHGRKFTLQMDHRLLLTIFASKNGYTHAYHQQVTAVENNFVEQQL